MFFGGRGEKDVHYAIPCEGLSMTQENKEPGNTFLQQNSHLQEFKFTVLV